MISSARVAVGGRSNAPVTPEMVADARLVERLGLT